MIGGFELLVILFVGIPAVLILIVLPIAVIIRLLRR
jgi:hypothetical protein